MQDTLQLFNYKVLTDSTTGHEFYAIDRQELTTVATVCSNKASTNAFTKGYTFGFINGLLWTIVIIYCIQLIHNYLQKR